VQITDTRALRALAHPLRLDLIELLGAGGPATAAECARRLGTSQASCSFHLRQLAKYGFVEEAQSSGDRRERPWQLTELEQRWSSETPGAEHFERVFVGREADRILAWRARAADDAESWRESAFLGGVTLPLTSAELADVRQRLRAVLDRYVVRLGDRSAWPRDARLVRVLLSGTPLDDSAETNEGEEIDDVDV
jgi:DNA-binding transcriptional ArsR family regulator